jgi:hypothetical protein
MDEALAKLRSEIIEKFFKDDFSLCCESKTDDGLIRRFYKSNFPEVTVTIKKQAVVIEKEE